MKPFYQRNKLDGITLDENLVAKIAAKLLEDKRILGRFVGRGESATFVPVVFDERREREITEAIDIKQNQRKKDIKILNSKKEYNRCFLPDKREEMDEEWEREDLEDLK